VNELKYNFAAPPSALIAGLISIVWATLPASHSHAQGVDGSALPVAPSEVPPPSEDVAASSPTPSPTADPTPAAGATSIPATAPASSSAPAEQTVEPAASLVLAPGKGLTATSGDKRLQVNLRSRVQLRSSLLHDDERSTLDTQVKTLRLVVAGYALVPELKYLIQFAFGAGDFDANNSSPVFDAFVEYTAIRDLNVRVGQFFVPFDRARTIREFALQFVDRQGVVRELTLDRDVGIMFSSQDLFGLGGRLGYNVFVGGGDGRNRVPDTKNQHGPQKPSVLLVGRLAVRPFGQFDDDQEGDVTHSPSPRLAIGVAGAYNIASNRDKSTYGATYTLGTYDYSHAAADLVFKWHGFSLLAEVLYRNANTKQHSGTTAMGMPLVERSRSGYGYFAQLGQMVTQKLEVVARLEELKGTSSPLKEEAKATGRQAGGGLNFYLNAHAFKLQSDYFFVFGQNTDAAYHAVRLQLDASF
jgi:phosphate-selective porin OprO and OprP